MLFIFQPSYRLAIRTEGMIEDLVSNLKSENYELQMHCASAIFKVRILCIYIIYAFVKTFNCNVNNLPIMLLCFSVQRKRRLVTL